MSLFSKFSNKLKSLRSLKAIAIFFFIYVPLDVFVKISEKVKKIHRKIFLYLFGAVIPTKNKELSQRILQKKVLSGVFEGLKYPQIKDLGFGIFSRLMGTYESELKEKIEKISDKQYELVIDIGCAEGYYVNGLAYRNKNMKIIGYDINAKELAFGQEMSKENGLTNTIFKHRFFDVNELKNALKKFNVNKKKCFIICDIDGGEKNLFKDDFLKEIEGINLLIETHDLMEIGIAEDLYQKLNPTHHIEIIRNIDETERPYHPLYQLDILQECNISEKYKLLNEGRTGLQKWFYCEAKNL